MTQRISRRKILSAAIKAGAGLAIWNLAPSLTVGLLPRSASASTKDDKRFHAARIAEGQETLLRDRAGRLWTRTSEGLAVEDRGDLLRFSAIHVSYTSDSQEILVLWAARSINSLITPGGVPNRGPGMPPVRPGPRSTAQRFVTCS